MTLRRLLFGATGVLLAGLAATVFLAAALLADASTRSAGAALAIVAVSAVTSTALQGDDPGHLLGLGLSLVWTSLLAVCFAPVAAAAIFGEAIGSRASVWYAGVSGALAAAVPTLARLIVMGVDPDRTASSAIEGRLTLIFFLTGVLGGWLYWAFAARH